MSLALRLLAALLFSASLAVPALVADPVAAQPKPAAEQDPLRAVLMESKDKNRGVAIHANGATINGVVVSVDDRYVTAKSQQNSRIVIRLDRIDGVSTLF
jgi:hypothetical protein